MRQQRLARGLLLVLLVLALGCSLSPGRDGLGVFGLDRWHFDWGMRHGVPGLAAVDSPGPLPVLVVGIDEASYAAFPEPEALWHQHLGAFLEAMARLKPAAVGLDVVLPDRSFDALVPGIDRRLLQGILALRQAKVPLVAVQAIQADGSLRPLYAPTASLLGQQGLAFPNVPVDSDAVVRRYLWSIGSGGVKRPSLAAAMAMRLGRGQASHAGELWIDFRRGQAFDYLPLSDLIEQADSGNLDALKARFSAAAVVLGPVLPFEDRHRLPRALAAWEPGALQLPGVLLHAQALRSILASEKGGLLRPVPWGWGLVLTVLSVLLGWFVRGRWRWLLLPYLSALWIGAWGLWDWAWLLPVGDASVWLLLSLSLRLAWQGWLSMRERRRLRAAFGPYVSPAVLRQILAGDIEADGEGRRRPLCVLFSDIRSFTTRSESQPPEATVRLLNRYFEAMTAAVHEHGGTIDKFIGDGLMAFFGAPEVLDDPCRSAALAAQAMVERLGPLNAVLSAEGVEPIRIGIGLHFGDAVVGHVGSSSRHEYTAIGDTVNLAARLESLTKGLGHQLVVSQTVADALPDWDWVALGEQPIKGRAAEQVFGAF